MMMQVQAAARRGLSVATRRGLSSYADKRRAAAALLADVEEVRQRDAFDSWLRSARGPRERPAAAAAQAGMQPEDAEVVLRAGFATFLSHVESRIASFVGEGFYTIGPCGEELMAVLGALMRESDPMALHYRHVGTQLARQMANSVRRGEKTIEEVLLDRARGPTVSMLDPVTGGHHCAIGGGKYDFYVTSTLASQAPPAVGRAMGIKLAPRLLPADELVFPKDAVSVVSIGDGSANNAMFLSACNLARYAQHRGFKCPVLFVITNNDMCISLRGYGYLEQLVNSLGLRVFKSSGAGDMLGLWGTTKEALHAVRKTSRPAVLVVDEVPRRFGHAATDRQNMYLSEEEIQRAVQTDPLREACQQALDAGLVSSPEQLVAWWDELRALTEAAFEKASAEPKLSQRQEVEARTQAPLAPLPAGPAPGVAALDLSKRERKRLETKPQPMRTHMNQVFKEAMAGDSAVVYVGEDVRHGGYYRVSDDLAALYPERVQDVPPDETSVIGISMGYAQAGLVPVCEIPYAKYLDCGADLFFEAVMMHWCTAGKQTNGMVIRLQGFDKGVFGGNFHTHNTLHLPPGLDVVCFSNGRDYVRGMRHALHQAKHAGRVVMSVDCTNLLFRRDLFEDANDGEGDAKWLATYPFDDSADGSDHAGPMLDFETVLAYPDAADPQRTVAVDGQRRADSKPVPEADVDVIVFSYGNGVPTALRATREMAASEDLASRKVLVVDCPTLGRATEGLREVLDMYPDAALVFADICKAGQHPFAGTTYDLSEDGTLAGRRWSSVAAPRTYNPLGSTLTFLNETDILGAVRRAL